MARPESGAALTPREEEIAGLVAQALTAAQVADRLFISVRTVHAHLYSIYAKTGTGSRARLTAWLAGRGTLPVPPRLIPAGNHSPLVSPVGAADRGRLSHQWRYF